LPVNENDSHYQDVLKNNYLRTDLNIQALGLPSPYQTAISSNTYFMGVAKVFIIDDDPDELFFYHEALGNSVLKVELSFFTNPEGVLPFLELQKEDQFPDAMILDLNMPKVDGLELLTKIKASSRYKSIPIIISTTSTSVIDRERCLQAGAEDCVPKPTKISQYSTLLARIAKNSESD
jgi:CheY-like chemotaxis protein